MRPGGVSGNEGAKCFSRDVHFKIREVEYFYPKLSDATVYNYSKQVVMSASDYIQPVYRDVSIFMQLTQNCAFIRYFDVA